MKEQLTTCARCGGNACYEQQFPFQEETVTTWLCMGCGFTTSTKMFKGSPVVQDALNTSPELFKDLMYEDKDGRIWLPSVLTLPAKGMIFVDGTNARNWKWAAAKAVRILDEEKKRFPKGQEYRVDMNNSKQFGQKQFIDAMDYIGFFDLE